MMYKWFLAILIAFMCSTITAEAQQTTEWIIGYEDASWQEQRLTADGITQSKINDTTALLTLPPQEMQRIKELAQDDLVAYIEPNYERFSMDLPNDPMYEEQWWLPATQAPAAWQYPTTGRAVVAVIDSGIDTKHPDLQGRIASAMYDFVANTTEMIDSTGHGTRVAGIIVAKANNGIGISGVVGDADIRVLPLRTANAAGSSKISAIVQAIDYAVAQRVAVINLSMGSREPSKAEQAAIERALAAGVVVVAASGNEAQKGNPINYPAAYDGVIAVGATNQYNDHAAFSNYNNFVTLVAPGEHVLTTSPNNAYRYVSGTSFATPMVAGAAALVKANEAGIRPEVVKERLIASAMDFGAPGYDPYYGHGLLNIKALVEPQPQLQLINPTLALDYHQPKIAGWLTPSAAFMLPGTTLNVGTNQGYVSDIVVATLQQNRIIARNYGATDFNYGNLDKAFQKQIKVGQSTNLPQSALFAQTSQIVYWMSEDDTIASVDDYGIVTGHSNGVVRIFAETASDYKQAVVKVTGFAPTAIVSPMKTWRINFSQPVDKETMYYAYISYDAAGNNRVPDIRYTTEGNAILLQPEVALAQGYYYLHVPQRIANQQGKTLTTMTQQMFYVQ